MNDTQNVEYLNSFSADVIASLTLAEQYDLKKVAYAISNLIDRLNEIESDTIKDLRDEILVLKNDYAVLKNQKNTNYPLHWGGYDIEATCERATSDLALKLTKKEDEYIRLENELYKLKNVN
jgi:hypothetical protein